MTSRLPPRQLLWLVCLLAGACGRDAADLVVASGTVEATEVNVAPLVSGRLVELRVREGQAVSLGDTVAVLARAETPGELEGARARLEGARARLRLLESGTRAEDLAAARAALQGAEADLQQAERDAERVQGLATQDLATPEQLDRVLAARALARSRRDIARETLARLAAGARAEELDAARAEVAVAEAAYAQVRAGAGELLLLSPIDGVVLLRNFERGEVVPAGTPVVTLLDPRDLWMRTYVGQDDLARIRLDQAGEVTADALPTRRFPARVVEISPRAEFTPRVALTERERADLVFAVRLAISDTTGSLKPGMPADGRIHTGPPAVAGQPR
jgi:HlyD family secretion protein